KRKKNGWRSQKRHRMKKKARRRNKRGGHGGGGKRARKKKGRWGAPSRGNHPQMPPWRRPASTVWPSEKRCCLFQARSDQSTAKRWSSAVTANRPNTSFRRSRGRRWRRG